MPLSFFSSPVFWIFIGIAITIAAQVVYRKSKSKTNQKPPKQSPAGGAANWMPRASHGGIRPKFFEILSFVSGVCTIIGTGIAAINTIQDPPARNAAPATIVPQQTTNSGYPQANVSQQATPAPQSTNGQASTSPSVQSKSSNARFDMTDPKMLQNPETKAKSDAKIALALSIAANAPKHPSLSAKELDQSIKALTEQYGEKLGAIPSHIIAQQTNNAALKIVDAFIDESAMAETKQSKNINAPTLDVKVRNDSNDAIFIKEIVFYIQKYSPLRKPYSSLKNRVSAMFVLAAYTYDIPLNHKTYQSFKISQGVDPKGIDHFAFTLSSNYDRDEMGTLFHLSVFLIYNETSTAVYCGDYVTILPSMHNTKCDFGPTENDESKIRREAWAITMSANYNALLDFDKIDLPKGSLFKAALQSYEDRKTEFLIAVE